MRVLSSAAGSTHYLTRALVLYPVDTMQAIALLLIGSVSTLCGIVKTRLQCLEHERFNVGDGTEGNGSCLISVVILPSLIMDT